MSLCVMVIILPQLSRVKRGLTTYIYNYIIGPCVALKYQLIVFKTSPSGSKHFSLECSLAS